MSESVFNFGNSCKTIGCVESKNVQDLVLETRQVGKLNSNLAIPIAFCINVSPGATSFPIFSSNAPYNFEITDVVIQCRNSNTGGTIQVMNGTSAITDAIICATGNNITRAVVVNSSYSAIAKGGSLSLACIASVDPTLTEGLVTIFAIKKV